MTSENENDNEHFYFVIYNCCDKNLEKIAATLRLFTRHEKLFDNFYIVKAQSCEEIETKIKKYFDTSDEFGYFIERIQYNFCTNLKNKNSLLLRLHNNHNLNEFKKNRLS